MTGVEMIAQEREEQISKHGWTIEHDKQYRDSELLALVEYIIKDDDDAEKDNIREYLFDIVDSDTQYCPIFPQHIQEKFDSKNNIERLVIAGALIAAEIDRLSTTKNT